MTTQTDTDMRTWFVGATLDGGQNVLRWQRDMLDTCFDMMRFWTTTWAAWTGTSISGAASFYRRVEGDLPVVEAVTSEVPAATSKPAPKAKAKTISVEPKADNRMDDLTLINGIGPGTEKKLHARGIVRFSQLAALTADQIDSLESELRFRGRIQRDDWLGQAKDLAASTSA